MPTFGIGVRVPRVLEQRPMREQPENEAVIPVQSPCRPLKVILCFSGNRITQALELFRRTPSFGSSSKSDFQNLDLVVGGDWFRYAGG